MENNLIPPVIKQWRYNKGKTCPTCSVAICNKATSCFTHRKASMAGKKHNPDTILKMKKSFKAISLSNLKPGKPRYGVTNPAWKGGITLDERAYNNARKKKHRAYYSFLESKRRARIRGSIGNFTFASWQTLKEKYGYQCLMCKLSEPIISLSIDHIIPISKGGKHDISNIQPLCRGCNAKKSNKILCLI